MESSLLVRFFATPDLHQSDEYKLLIQKLGWEAIGEPGNRLFIRRLGPLHIAKLQRPAHLDIAWLKSLRQKHHLLLTYVEPGITHQDTSTFGLKVEPFAHSQTSLIDLSLTEAELLSSFKPKTRYNIRYAQKQNFIKIISTPLAKLTNLQKQTFLSLHASWSQARNVHGYDDTLLNAVLSSFAGHGKLHLAYDQTQCVAALLILYHHQVATYYAAFATGSGYSHYAPTLLTWVAIKNAQSEGCTIFDFGGIYDARYPGMYKRWRGFTKFKEGFSPTVATYPPTRLLLGW